MKCFIYLFYFFINISCFAKSDTSNLWLRYYQTVHAAESDIVDKNEKEALEKYQLAFKTVDSPLGKDYYNAMVCAIRLNKEKIAFKYLWELCTLGYKLSYLPQSLNDKLLLYKSWKKFEKNLPYIERIHLKNINIGLKDTLIQLDFDDQKFRKLDKTYSIYQDTINKIDTVNYRIFKRILMTHGIPGEKIIGIHSGSFTQPYYGLVRHYTGDRNQPSISSKLKEEVMLGRLNPKYFGWLESVKNDIDLYGTKLTVEIDNRRYLYNYNEELKSKINKKRQAIGLESLEELIKKIMFEEHDKDFRFCIFSGKSKFEFADDYSKQRFLLNLTEIK